MRKNIYIEHTEGLNTTNTDNNIDIDNLIKLKNDIENNLYIALLIKLQIEESLDSLNKNYFFKTV